MGECTNCGKNLPMPFKCKFCGASFCSEHRLPENHECKGLEDYKKKKKEKDDRITYDAMREEREHRRSNRPLLTRIKARLHQWKERIASFFTGGRSRRRHSRPSATMHAMNRAFPEVATYGLLGLIFVGFLLQTSISNFTRMFALSPQSILSEPWRVITTIFLHAGTGHLFVNSLVLYFFGAELERRVGTRTFLKIFFFAGIIGSLGFSLWAKYMGINIPAVGASGALYGVFAALAVIAPEIRVLAFFVIPMGIRSALVFFAVIDIFLLTGTTPIASAAHLSGLVAGLYYGFKLKNRKKTERSSFIVQHF